VFVQDEVALQPDRLSLTFGTKIEHNDFTGWEVQPSARLAWTPHPRHTLWASVSRAVRTPSRSERGFGLFVKPPFALRELPVPILAHAMGHPDFGSEDLLAYEFGYRVQAHAALAFDASVFYNQYDNLASSALLPVEFRAEPEPHLFIPGTWANDVYGESYGTEATAIWQPVRPWRIRASYSLLKLNLHTRGPIPSIYEISEKYDPQQQVFVWSDLDLGNHWEWGVGFRYVDDRRGTPVREFTALDTSLTWKPTRHCELTLTGRNLLDPHHREASPPAVSVKNVQVDRAVYAKLTLKF
jgi:iron complex outermembrane receptor protein